MTDFLYFLRHHKRWWMLPVVIFWSVVVLIGLVA